MSPVNDKITIDAAKRAQFEILFEEFLEVYPPTEGGRNHIERYEPSRGEAQENFEQIVEAAERGEDITDKVLLKLLPYGNTSTNREKGAWTPLAPAIQGDLQKWYEAQGWTDPGDWPHVAQAILDFVRRCNDNPKDLEAACKAFDDLPYTTGFQTGMLTPILNALRPEEFLLINNKSRDTINHFAGTSHSQKLREYPETNATGWALIQEFAPVMHRFDMPDLRDSDLFDMFSHWLVAVKGFNFRPVRYWKIAPGEKAWNWDACLEGGFIAIGWDELGDVSEMEKSEFDERLEALDAEYPDGGWNKFGAGQVWTFAHEIQEGDRVVANRGTTEVLGIGTVLGAYEFVPDERHGHRLPVTWDDLTPRRVNEGGWRSTLVKLDRDKFETIRNAMPFEADNDLAEPFSRIFEDREEAEWAFDLLEETLQRLGVTDASDKRFSLTLRHNGQALHLNFGNWAVMVFYASGDSSYRVGIALIEDQVDVEGDIRRWRDFAQDDDEPGIRLLGLPIQTVRPLEGTLREVYENTLVHIAKRFEHWKASPYRKYGVPEIEAAIFDPEKRSALLTHGITEPLSEVGYFTSRTFELLEDLHEDPTAAYYMDHKDAFEAHLLEPFKRLFHDVAERLPPAISNVMETERWLFSRIPKNDFGQGGAWDFYWGAFYPKGSKRTQDAQLSLWINHERLEFGFYIGDYGAEQRQRFLRQCREHYQALNSALGDTLSSDDIVFGRHKDIVVNADGTVESTLDLTWQEWLQHPDQADFDVSVVLLRDEVLACSEDELANRIAQIYERFFPLVLLAIEDDPLVAIDDYLDLDDPEKLKRNPVYSIARCAEESFFDEATLAQWVRAIERKKQAILYGPPGTGKTYLAERLAKHLIGGGDGFSEVVQFHPAYAYEDFIQGLRPDLDVGGGLRFNRAPGRFLDFCRKARACEGRCVLIIDEINRANLSRVFGELMYLLEYRDRDVPLAAGGRFDIPENVRIIGTMNTADRSIALVDHALRRRFAFLALYPDYDILRRYHISRQTGFDVEPLIQVLKRLNRQIDDQHYAVGITFFLLPDLSRHIEDIWRMEIEPYLEEYFFDQSGKVELFRWPKIGAEISL